MKKKDLIQLLSKLNFHPGKLLGQNFLIDDNLLEFIQRSSNVGKGDRVLEVGPGFGALTRKILETGANLTAIEFDRRICEYLRDNVLDDNFKLVEGDACRQDIDEIMGKEKFHCVANLPYSVSTPFIGELLNMDNPPASMIFMLQKEMGERIASKPGKKSYGSLSIRVQTLYNVNIERIVPPQVFFPSPAVESAILKFSLKSGVPEKENRIRLFTIIKSAFARRRKKMVNNLSSIGDKKIFSEVFEELGIREDVRAEQLSVDEFISIEKCYRERTLG